MAAPQSLQSLPQKHCSRAGLQLPIALPCLTMGPAEPGAPVGPCPDPTSALPCPQGDAQRQGLGLTPATLLAGWGSGAGPGCQALSTQAGDSQWLPTPSPPGAVGSHFFVIKKYTQRTTCKWVRKDSSKSSVICLREKENTLSCYSTQPHRQFSIFFQIGDILHAIFLTQAEVFCAFFRAARYFLLTCFI